MLAGDDAIALDHAHGESDEIELSRLHRARVLGHLPADERAPRGAATFRDALHQLLDVAGVELADGNVIEEKQRLGPLAHQVVDTHRDEVDADRFELADRLRDEGLGTDTVRR